jgi:hypothetical protein
MHADGTPAPYAWLGVTSSFHGSVETIDGYTDHRGVAERGRLWPDELELSASAGRDVHYPAWARSERVTVLLEEGRRAEVTLVLPEQPDLGAR